MFDFSFSNIVHSNLINFILMIIILACICKKLNVGQKIEDMRANIEKSVTDSDKEKVDSEQELKDISKSLENLDTELEAILKRADENVQIIKENSAKELENSIKKAEDNSAKILNFEEKKVKQDLSLEFSLDAIEKAKGNLQNDLQNNYELHKKFIDESIDELDRLEI